MPSYITVPGLNDSGPRHWQSWLEQEVPGSKRIQLESWVEPDLRRWTDAISEALLAAKEPTILIAHSFGCLASIRAARRFPQRIRGLLLVAPADPRRFDLDPNGFRQRSSVRSVVVGSENDPWMTLWDAQALAEGLGGEFLNLGRAGHINVASGYGAWPGALLLLRGLERPLIRPPIDFRRPVSTQAPIVLDAP